MNSEQYYLFIEQLYREIQKGDLTTLKKLKADLQSLENGVDAPFSTPFLNEKEEILTSSIEEIIPYVQKAGTRILTYQLSKKHDIEESLVSIGHLI